MLIYLMGYMGSGKTTIGKALADVLEFKFLDLDEYIETESKAEISKIFKTLGESEFRLIEYKLLRQASLNEKTVISLGGGTPCFFNNIKFINQCGISFYLRCSPEILAGRLKDGTNKRPLIKNFELEELKEYINIRLAERRYYYSKANYIIDASKDIDQIVSEIKDIVTTNHL